MQNFQNLVSPMDREDRLIGKYQPPMAHTWLRKVIECFKD